MHQINVTYTAGMVGSDETYRAVRAAFVVRGTTLNAWCKANGFNRQTVEKALKGLRHSSTGAQIRERIAAELFGQRAA